MKTKKLWMQKCDVCGAVTQSSNCKIVCPNCGAQMDCSDLTITPDDPANNQEKIWYSPTSQ